MEHNNVELGGMISMLQIGPVIGDGSIGRWRRQDAML